MSNRERPEKSYGAGIKCVICGSEPWPSDPSVKESFNLRRFGPNGAPAESPAEGEWRCSEHFPPRQNIPPATRVTPRDAVAEFEQLLLAQGARLEEELAIRSGSDDDNNDAAFEAYRGELDRGLASLRKAIAPREPPSPGDTPKLRRPKRKPITANERAHEGQGSLIEEEAAEP
jgi:hypothetical protein